MGFTNIAKTISAKEDEEIWVEPTSTPTEIASTWLTSKAE